MSAQQIEREQRVAPFELFFDLVFVFGFTEVTTLLSRNPTWSGLLHGLLILATLWWAWAAYAWLTNVADPNEGRIWGTILWPLLVLANPDIQPLSVRLPSIQSQTELGVFLAAMFIACLVPIGGFLFFQRSFLRGSGLGGAIKG